MKQVIKLWKHWGRFPEAQKVHIASALTYTDFQKWLELNVPDKSTSIEAIKAVYNTRRRHSFIGKYDSNSFEIQLVRSNPVRHLNFATPLTVGKFTNTSDGLIIELTVGVKRPYWFWKLIRMFLSLFLAMFIIIPFLGMSLEGVPFDEMITVGYFFIFTLPIVTIAMFALFDFLPLRMIRRTQERTVNTLLEEFKAT